MNLKLVIKMLTSHLNFFQEVYLINLGEVSLKGNTYDFSVDYGSIDKSDTQKNDNYLMSKNNIKYYSACLLDY